MGVDEIFDYLKSNGGKYFTTIEIARGIRISPVSVRRSIKSLVFDESIDCTFLPDNNTGRKVWRYAYKKMSGGDKIGRRK